MNKKNMRDTFKVCVYDNDNVLVDRIGNHLTEKAAQRVKRGIEVNLNHEKYYVEIEVM